MNANTPKLVLLPGLDGTGRLFARFEAVLGGHDYTPVSYPTDEVLGYEALVERVVLTLPVTSFVLVAESFSGPIALKVAQRKPHGLRGVVLVASFVQNPVAWLPRWSIAALAPIVGRMPPPAFLVRKYLLGHDADAELVGDFIAASRMVDARVFANRVRELGVVDASDALAQCRDAPHLVLQRRPAESLAAIDTFVASLRS